MQYNLVTKYFPSCGDTYIEASVFEPMSFTTREIAKYGNKANTETTWKTVDCDSLWLLCMWMIDTTIGFGPLKYIILSKIRFNCIKKIHSHSNKTNYRFEFLQGWKYR